MAGTPPLNPADYKIPELGLLGRAMIPTPASPGMEFAGVVARIGDAVDVFYVAQRVYGGIGPNRYGTLVYPRESLEDASCIGTAAQTARRCIVPNVKERSKIFINGDSGGAGTFGIQIAKAVQIGVQILLNDLRTTASRAPLASFLGGSKRKYEYATTKDNYEDLVRIGEWMREGKVRTVIDEIFQYEDAPRVVGKLKRGHARRKIVIKACPMEDATCD
ncbi:hypothetical protein AAE478_009875 [Parahypoxylon ruwenzoriense]